MLSPVVQLRISHHLARDLKPENVLLTADNPPQAKVADFGLAKMVDSVTFLRVSMNQT